MFKSKGDEVFQQLPLADRAKDSIVDVNTSIQGLDAATFIADIKKIVDTPPEIIVFPQSSLYADQPDRALVFTNPNFSQKLAGVTSFHFPGASGQWDEERCGAQFDGYAGAALRGGISRAIILDWSYADATTDTNTPSASVNRRPRISNEIADVIDAVKVSGAKKVYLSGRSYGAFVVLFSIPEVRKLEVDIVGIDLKVPAIASSRYNIQIADSLGEIPVIITRGDRDSNTSIPATNDLYRQLHGPKAMVTLTDRYDKRGRFNHHLSTPELRFAAAAASETFIKSI